MDERRTRIPLQALGEPFPRLDDHLVEPEVTRDEIIAGRRVVASPAKWPHATSIRGSITCWMLTSRRGTSPRS